MSEIKHIFKTRFAPSPTGLMHFGNLRAALFNYLLTRQKGGVFLLRIEDTDEVRSEKQYAEAIQGDLKWLGIHWDEGPFYQSERQAIYNGYYGDLEASGFAYPCFCTEQQLSLTRKIQLSRGEPPRYPGTCRGLTEEAKAQKLSEGIKPTLRFHIPRGGIVEFVDVVKGPQRFECDHLGDFIIRRGDGTSPFMFCNAIDDALMGITHTLRGDDHLTNTPRQILILKTLGLPIPEYGHFPTILGPDGSPLSKRNGSRSIQELRKEGYHPLGLFNYLARLGHYYEEPGYQDVQALIEHFKVTHINTSPAHYDGDQLAFWQKEAMHRVPLEDFCQLIEPFVKDRVPKDKQKEFASIVQPNTVMPHEVALWVEALFAPQLTYTGEESKVIHDVGSEFFEVAIRLLKRTENTVTFQNWLNQLQIETGRKGKAIFFPLRAALTAELHGPELVRILELMGIECVLKRLHEAASYAAHL